MSRHYTTAVLILATLVTLFFAYRGFGVPAGLGARLGLVVSSADGLNEIRAQYGGFFFAVALTCALALAKIVEVRTALILVLVVFGGVLFGRLVSLPLDGGFAQYGQLIKTLFVLDTIIVGTTAAALVLNEPTFNRMT